LSKVLCNKRNCINYQDGYCSIVKLEKVGNDCLDFEDAMDSLRLRVDVIRGTLG
jgi:hypothetical protein